VFVLLVLGFLASLSIATLRRHGPKAEALQCLANLRRVTAAVAMYAGDNSDLFPPNPDDGTTEAGYNWCGGSVMGGMPPGSPADPGMTDSDLLKDPNTCLVTPYLLGDIGGFRCPADPRYGAYGGSDPAQMGEVIPAVRSISMNGGVGTLDPVFHAHGAGHGGKPTVLTNGPWLTGSHGYKADSPYATFGKTTDFAGASPARILILADESPWTINDASLSVCAGSPMILDAPAIGHNHGGSFSFGDGHAELHRWGSQLLEIETPGPAVAQAAGGPGAPAYEDWHWLAWHATVNLKTGTVP
jgi:hypothetical protein